MVIKNLVSILKKESTWYLRNSYNKTGYMVCGSIGEEMLMVLGKNVKWQIKRRVSLGNTGDERGGT
jgi:hypothetical protein